MKLVSVIMSTYNESIEVLRTSVESILNQTYSNLQFIIVNDNPERKDLSEYLKDLSNSHRNIKYLINDTNVGLVASLNRGIKEADGEYIARMDADDESELDRIEIQLRFLEDNDLDLVGSSAITVDKSGNAIGAIRVPVNHEYIYRYHKYGSCLLHPTWFGKKSIFVELHGYRRIFSCEDYDFVMRAMKCGYRLGNVAMPLLKYRIRKEGISVSMEARQKLVTSFINKNFPVLCDLTENDFDDYVSSPTYQKEYEIINRYIEAKNSLKKNKNLLELLNLIFNKYFYKALFAKVIEKYRNKFSEDRKNAIIRERLK